MKKIGFINIFSHYAGGEIYLKRLIENQVEEDGNEYYLFTVKNDKLVNGLNPKIKIITLEKNGTSYWDFFIFSYFLIKKIKELSMSIIILNGDRALYLSNFINKKAKIIGIKHMLLEGKLIFLKKIILNMSLRKIDKLITISEFHFKNYKKNNIDLKKVQVIYNSVDQNYFNLKKSDFNKKELIFLETASLIERKGQVDILEACKILKKNGYKFKVLLIGEGEDEKKIKNLIIKYKLETTVSLLGFKENVKEYLEKCNVFLLPSYSEGLPLSILEAMSIGRPIISTNIAGIPEIVLNKVNGFLIEPGDYQELANKMKYFIENVDEIKKMGIKSRELILEKFTEEGWNKEWRDILN